MLKEIFDLNIIVKLKELYIDVNKNIRSKALVYKSVMNKFPEFYDIYKKYYNKEDFREIIYCLLKDINDIPKCLNPNCMNKTKLRNFVIGFLKCCCKKCVAELLHLSESHSLSCKLAAIKRYKNKSCKVNRLSSYNVISDNNYYIINNYCEHGNISIYKKIAKLIDNIQDCSFCYKCNENIFNKYIPTETDIIGFQNSFPEFYNKNHYKMKYKWWITYYPKYLKIIITYFEKYIRKYNQDKDNLLELYYVFLNKIKSPVLCAICNNPVEFSYTGNCYRKFCEKHLIGFNTSTQELNLENFIKTLNIPYIKNDRSIIVQELDFYFPNKHIAIEFNGCWWHCEKFKDKQYHYNKWKQCYDKNIQLITIWEDDYLYKQDIVKNIIKVKLNIFNKILYARNCIIKEISYIEAKDFINQYHLQGYTIDKIRLGLFYNNELVSVMTFGKSRFNKNENETELIRYCVKSNYKIIGGASKLFKYFINNYSFNKIISYAEADISIGTLYKKLGFKLCSFNINFKWLYKGIRYNRLNKIKDKNKNLIYKCYNSGILKFIYESNKNKGLNI